MAGNSYVGNCKDDPQKTKLIVWTYQNDKFLSQEDWEGSWEIAFANHISNKGLGSKIHKEFSKFGKKQRGKNKTPIRK